MPKLKCDNCGNTDPDDFRFRETRHVYVHVQVDENGEAEPGEWDTDVTLDSHLYCEACNGIVCEITGTTLTVVKED